MTLGLGLTSTLAAQQDSSDTEPSPNRVDSVAVKEKEMEDFVYLNKPKEVNDYDELIRQANAEQKRKDEQRREEIRKREELERKRIAEEKRQRELAEKRAQQLAAIKIEEQRKARERAQAQAREQEQAKARAARQTQAQPQTQSRTQSQPSQQATSSSVKGTLNIEFSYYVAMCDSGCTGKTATGIDVRNTIYYQGMRIVATDPSVIPTWSIIQFEMNGQKVKAIALDTGGYIQGHRIDMLVGSTSEANSLGRHTKQVEILRYGK